MSNFLVLFFYLQKIIHAAKLKQNLLRQLLNSRGDHCVVVTVCSALITASCAEVCWGSWKPFLNRTTRCLLLQPCGVSLDFPYVQLFVPLCEVGWKESINKRKQVIVEERGYFSLYLPYWPPHPSYIYVLTQNSETWEGWRFNIKVPRYNERNCKLGWRCDVIKGWSNTCFGIHVML